MPKCLQIMCAKYYKLRCTAYVLYKKLYSSKSARLLDPASKFALFSVSGLKDIKLIIKEAYTKTETCKLYSRVFWIFLPNFIKIDRYNFELYRFKVGAFFWDTVYSSSRQTAPGKFVITASNVHRFLTQHDRLLASWLLASAYPSVTLCIMAFRSA